MGRRRSNRFGYGAQLQNASTTRFSSVRAVGQRRPAIGRVGNSEFVCGRPSSDSSSDRRTHFQEKPPMRIGPKCPGGDEYPYFPRGYQLVCWGTRNVSQPAWCRSLRVEKNKCTLDSKGSQLGSNVHCRRDRVSSEIHGNCFFWSPAFERIAWWPQAYLPKPS